MQLLLCPCWGHTMLFVKTKSQGLSIYTILVITTGTVRDRALWYLQQSLSSQHGWPSENPARNKRVFVADKSHLSDNSPILEEQSIWYAINYIKKCWDTSKLQLLIYLNFSYAIHFQSASMFAFEKCDQPTKGFRCSQCQIFQPPPALSDLGLMAKQDGVWLPQKVAFKPTETRSLEPVVLCCIESFPTSPWAHWSQFYCWFCGNRLQLSISLSVCFQNPFCSASSKNSISQIQIRKTAKEMQLRQAGHDKRLGTVYYFEYFCGISFLKSVY